MPAGSPTAPGSANPSSHIFLTRRSALARMLRAGARWFTTGQVQGRRRRAYRRAWLVPEAGLLAPRIVPSPSPLRLALLADETITLPVYRDVQICRMTTVTGSKFRSGCSCSYAARIMLSVKKTASRPRGAMTITQQVAARPAAQPDSRRWPAAMRGVIWAAAS